MVDMIKSALGFGPEVDFLALKEAGAIVIDVRSKAEFQSGHGKKAINIPLDQIDNKAKELKKKNKPIITCCVSGARSGAAKRKLQAAGVEAVYNGGNWSSLESKLSK
ncbi:MAG: rhodanese-like domain-containing protein [Vicingaceae bacterium]